MNEPFELDAVDVDGAIRETAERVDGHTRGAFLRKAGIGVGAIVGGSALMGALPQLASAAATSDTDILNFALTLEYLESAFYSEAVKKGALSGETKTFAKVVAGHEAAHVAALKGALGSSAVAKPKFDFKGTTDEPGQVPGHLRGARVHRRQRLPRPGREHQVEEGPRCGGLDPARSRPGTRPGSPTSAATARSPTPPRRRSPRARRRRRSSPPSRAPASSSASPNPESAPWEAHPLDLPRARPPAQATTQAKGIEMGTGLLSPTHLIFLAILALLLFGAKRLPEMARWLGTGLHEFKSSVSGLEHDAPGNRPVAAPVPTETALDQTPPVAERDAIEPAAVV